MRAAIGIVVGIAVAAIVVACGGPGQNKAAAPTINDGGNAPEAVPHSPRGEIDQLDADIKANLARLQIEEPPAWTAMSASDPRPMAEIKSACTPSPRPSQTCGDICNLSSHICDNADRICVLSDELQPDEYARGKCEDGKKSCEAGRKRCCECM